MRPTMPSTRSGGSTKVALTLLTQLEYGSSDSATVPGRVEIELLDVSGLGVRECDKAKSGHCHPTDSD